MTTHGKAYQHIAGTKEEAEREALREWEYADREPFPGYDRSRAAEITTRIPH